MTMPRPWHEDENFWLAFAPVLFRSSRWSAAEEEMQRASALLALAPGASVLDACCGVGRHSIELARLGYRVTGLDRMGAFLAAAKETAKAEGVAVEFVREDIRRFSRPGYFDGAVSWFTSIGYFSDSEEERLGLENIRRSLKPGGRFVIDMMGKEIVARWFKTNEWFEDEAGYLLSEYRITDDWSRLENRWILITKDAVYDRTFSHRVFSAVELRLLLLESGFKRVEIFGDADRIPYDQDAKRLIAIAEAP